ncbi:MAG: hypothetical protein DWP97_00830 [Calditrichaeota bacterium]|nr:MAG: hypothetical protein DWP97_00830 [Calditrichota bacterium]
MNFDYMTAVIRMAAATVGHTANAASATHITDVIDMGDGQGLEINWGSDCTVGYSYKLIYGTTAGIFTDTVDVPDGSCSYTLNGLTEGSRYYVSVVGESSEGIPALYTIQSSGVPLVIPLAPNSLNIEPDLNSVVISWADNKEADLDYYNIYRNGNFGYELVGSSNSPTYTDSDVVGQYEYEYVITAVDFDGNESGQSISLKSFAGTFDGGMLAVDEIFAGAPMPDQSGQEVYIHNVFNGLPYSLYDVTLFSNRLNKSNAGRYSSVIWFDDDLNNKLIATSNTTLDWFCSYNTNICLTGFRTLAFWESSPFSPGDLLYDQFKIAGYEEHGVFDFAGAFGDNGFPDVEVNLANPFGNLPYIPILDTLPGATVIYRYNSASDDGTVEGEPCGILYDSPNGKRIVLGFPLYFLTDESAQNLVSYISALFGETFTQVPGDINNSDDVDISDLIYLVNYIFLNGGAPLDMNSADVDGTCSIDISDVVYLVQYIFGTPAGPAPQPGCVY